MRTMPPGPSSQPNSTALKFKGAPVRGCTCPICMVAHARKKAARR